MRTVALLSLFACSSNGEVDLPVTPKPWFRVALLTDPHITGPDYVCCENSELDTESIYLTTDRLIAAQDQINAIDPAPELALIAGDLFHQNYKYPAIEDYLSHETAAGNAASLLDRFVMPAYPAWGNHDYEVPDYPRELSHQIFAELFHQQPYYAVDHEGWKFLLTNTQLGATWDPLDAMFNTSQGSFGAEQLAWIDAQLDEGMPTVLVFHHPLIVVEQDETEAGGIFEILDRHRDNLALIIVGHTHRWLDFTEALDLPNILLGATRYDEDNFWIGEFQPQGSDWRILDREKAVWGSVEGLTWDYEAGKLAE